jgi:Fe-S-cluster containining protein
MAPVKRKILKSVAAVLPRPQIRRGIKRKAMRTVTAVLPVAESRRGDCNNCGACCTLPTPCWFLRYREDGSSFCAIYHFRPPNCRKYPRTHEEFITQETCGFWFEGQDESSVEIAVDRIRRATS